MGFHYGVRVGGGFKRQMTQIPADSRRSVPIYAICEPSCGADGQEVHWMCSPLGGYYRAWIQQLATASHSPALSHQVLGSPSVHSRNPISHHVGHI
jgi:hypothetical protein